MLKVLNKNIYLFILFFLLLLLCYFYLMIGISSFSVLEVWNVLTNNKLISGTQFVVGDVRFPRVIIGILCGAMFAMSGSLLQCVLRNPMAAPDILGVNSACSLFILLFTFFIPNSFAFSNLIYAACGGCIGFFVTILSSLENKRINQTRLIIVGVAVGALFKACCQFIIMQSDERQSSLVSFLTGTLYHSSWNSVQQIIYPACFLIFITFFLYRQLDILLLSEETSSSIGFKVTKWKVIVILLALMLASVAVSGSGSLGFIGLIAPNIAKILFGYSHKYNLFGSCLIGATLTLLSDLIGRIIFPPYEIPAGLVSIIIGAPYFLYLMKNIGRYK
ncbi:FecCD family ABC transporter permease [Fluviispira multicolorata]|uniref:Iron chelate uptake ABC transporter family permease subunit n=1 Tax=Fluviispira multicolorata TaxID=2654512 RepID=A0A833JF52_9BACT|nr:iron ABC transporter permease [Fluviispira multicolorata]KAB8033555.1 iron chelate uptake ABC transporter family permease subunit [Fluviispira multicolorata]